MLSRDDGDADYASAVAAAIDLTKSVLFVTCGAGDDGAFFLSGPEALVDSLSSKVSAPLTWVQRVVLVTHASGGSPAGRQRRRQEGQVPGQGQEAVCTRCRSQARGRDSPRISPVARIRHVLHEADDIIIS